jgi:hypothetical protein
MTVDSLSGILERVKPALHRAGQAVPRFSTYVPRLEAALEAAASGDGRFITDPRVDSVHNIWFECHEDFLTVLGRDREEEGSYWRAGSGSPGVHSRASGRQSARVRVLRG